MKNLKLQINTPLPKIIKIITESEIKQINFTTTNYVNVKTSDQKSDNNTLVGNNSFISIVNKKIYWYGVGTGIVIGIIVNLLSSFIYDLIK